MFEFVLLIMCVQFLKGMDEMFLCLLMKFSIRKGCDLVEEKFG